MNAFRIECYFTFGLCDLDLLIGMAQLHENNNRLEQSSNCWLEVAQILCNHQNYRDAWVAAAHIKRLHELLIMNRDRCSITKNYLDNSALLTQDFYNQATIYEESSHMEEAIFYYNLSACYRLPNIQYVAAGDLWLEAARLCISLKQSARGILFSELAIQYYYNEFQDEKFLSGSEQQQIYECIVHCHECIAQAQYQMNNIEEAIKPYELALLFYQNIEDINQVACCHSNLAFCHKRQDDGLEQANYHFLSAAKLFLYLDDLEHLSLCCNELIGLAKKNQLEYINFYTLLESLIPQLVALESYEVYKSLKQNIFHILGTLYLLQKKQYHWPDSIQDDLYIDINAFQFVPSQRSDKPCSRRNTF